MARVLEAFFLLANPSNIPDLCYNTNIRKFDMQKRLAFGEASPP